MKRQKFLDFKERTIKVLHEQSFKYILENKELRKNLTEVLQDKSIFRTFLKENELTGNLILTESQSLLRVIERIEGKSFQMLTQFGQNYSIGDNLNRNKEMTKVLRHRFKTEFNMPIEKTGFYQLVGHFPEKQDDGTEKLGKEYSQLWIKPDEMSNDDFKYLMIDVACVEYEQDSVFIFDNESDVQYLYKISDSFRNTLMTTGEENDGLIEKVETEGGLSYYKVDKERLLNEIETEIDDEGTPMDMSNLSINKMGYFYSRMRGKQKRVPFVFEGFRYPSSPQKDKFLFKRSGILFD